MFFFFFKQKTAYEIFGVTGVQTCALPIYIMVPHNIPLAVIGATLLWIGWFGFNAGSALASGSLAANTLLVTHIGASTSAVVWIALSWKRARRPSSTAAINGAIAGLAGVTPAAGFISAQNSFLLGIVLGFASYYAILLLKEHLKIDDALDVSSVHGVTGIVGSLAIGRSEERRVGKECRSRWSPYH